ncbi:MAG: RNA pseudouridine synthase, partial [Chloroflexi bacterium CG07_land_8_20_14_0_80_51_10]
MTEIMELVVDNGGVRLDKYIAGHCELSRSYIQNLIKEGKVLVDGHPTKASQKVTAEERIAIAVPPPTPIAVTPEDIPLNIV